MGDAASQAGGDAEDDEHDGGKRRREKSRHDDETDVPLSGPAAFEEVAEGDDPHERADEVVAAGVERVRRERIERDT
ncbi:hypothetical protein DU504_03405 [Haloplanus salinus]|uniref:Uncharacterized protein n=1 Tax=Haloplanus salinus TaxID=1126245 RepID=A0A368N773_9EURY|nr:hypothetical protein [Haloplanus salinus]RCU46437.1 hypothetical protein DU504_03405 [Haloplanus salinus]